jgi:integrase
LTDGKGVQYGFWRHMPKIWHFNQVAESYGQDEKTSVSIEWKLDQVVKAYSTTYELTLYILTDICLKIAEIKSIRDPYSKAFVEKYTQKAKSNSTISRNDLLQYLNRQSFLDGWQCGMLKSAFIRNKIAHADYYYDAEENTLVFGKRPYKLEEFKKLLKGMNSFYCYFLWKYLQEAGIMGMIDELSQLRDATKQLIDTDTSMD